MILRLGISGNGYDYAYSDGNVVPRWLPLKGEKPKTARSGE